MLLERTISQLDIGRVPAQEARQMAQLGYMQWIASLPGDANYRRAALHAHAMAAPYITLSPAVAEFCALLKQSLTSPAPLPLSLPPRKRRGGAGARRIWRLAH